MSTKKQKSYKTTVTVNGGNPSLAVKKNGKSSKTKALSVLEDVTNEKVNHAGRRRSMRLAIKEDAPASNDFHNKSIRRSARLERNHRKASSRVGGEVASAQGSVPAKPVQKNKDKKEASRKPPLRSKAKNAKHTFKHRTSRHEKQLKKKSAFEYKGENHSLVGNPFLSASYTQNVAPHDAPNLEKELETAQYATDIYQRLFQAETRFKIVPYTNLQAHMTPTSRHCMVDWMHTVCRKFLFLNETFHLSVYIFDRFCSKVKIVEEEIQLIAMAALWLASKYEELYPADVTELLEVAGTAYSVEDMVEMEINVLQMIDYKISTPTSFAFLQRFVYLTSASQMASQLAAYYCERALLNEEILNFRPSEVAAAAVYLAISHPSCLQSERYSAAAMSAVLEDYTKFQRNRVKFAASMIVDEMSSSSLVPTSAEKKYTLDSFQQVSELARPSLRHLAFE